MNTDNFYSIKEKVDSAKFFSALNKFFKNATTVYLEGSSISKDVIKIYQRYIEDGLYIPKQQIIFPKSIKFRCRFSDSFINELLKSSENHAEPELFDHFYLYNNEQPIIIWTDAFYDTLYIFKSISDFSVNDFTEYIKVS